MLLRKVLPLPYQPAFSASVDDNDLDAYTSTSGGTVDTITVNVTASGGTAPYFYSWSPDTSIHVLPDHVSASVYFEYTGHGIASTSSHTFVCTVTDSASHVAYVSVHVRMQAGGSPP